MFYQNTNDEDTKMKTSKRNCNISANSPIATSYASTPAPKKPFTA